LFKYIDIKIFKIVYADGTIELASEELLRTDVSESIADKANAQTSLLRSDIYDFFDTFMQSRAALPYRIDGLVITPVDSSHTTMHNGLYADYVALKHVEKTAITQLIGLNSDYVIVVNYFL
jgi:NAD-dependent DNA ligase